MPAAASHTPVRSADRRWDRLAAYACIAFALVVLYTFVDFGITWDEDTQITYGELVLRWYASGFADQSALHYRNLYYYGGLFEVAGELAYRVSPLGLYYTRHLLGGQRRDMTVLFSDIRGFTTASEAGTPEAVVRQLNEYFGAMVEVLFRHQGTLDKFVGDMVMGLFGAPLDDPHHADHAVAAALEMSRELARLNEGWRASGQPVLDIGIGINSGEMIAGNIGSTAIMSYTVIGDAVNLGSRLESLNKDYRTHILISEATRARLTIDVRTRPIGEVTVKGRQQPVLVHEVLA